MNGVSLANEKYGKATKRRVVHFAMTLEQFEKLEDLAMLAGMNVSEYCRSRTIGESPKRS